MKALRIAGRLALGLLGLIAGSVASGCPAYGMVEALYGPFPPPKPHDPSVSVIDFSYSPAAPVAPGASLEFSATTNKPTDAGLMQATVGDPPLAVIPLRDDGQAPDAVADDGRWVGEWVVPAAAEPGTLPTAAQLYWYDQAPPLELAGPPLVIETEGSEP